MPNKILMVVTSHDQLGDTGKRTLATGAWARRVPPAAPALTGRRGCRAGKKTGFWLEEYAAPYYVFKDAGAQITVASPKGGQPPLDPASEGENFQTAATRRFTEDKEATALLAASVKLETCDVAAFDAVFYPGGHGPMWDLAKEPASIKLIEAFWAAQKPVGSVCHGVAALIECKTPDGKYKFCRHAALPGMALRSLHVRVCGCGWVGACCRRRHYPRQENDSIHQHGGGGRRADQRCALLA